MPSRPISALALLLLAQLNPWRYGGSCAVTNVVINSKVAPPPDLAPQQVAPKTPYAYNFSAQPWIQYPGGLYKAATISNFPASATMSGALYKLNAGGMREMHWHDPNEWAYVISGTCRATLVDQGNAHTVDSWDFAAGDVWFFAANLPHVVIGAGDAGCTFVAVYDAGDFDERLNARGLSDWFTSVPAGVAAQAFGLPNTSVVTSNLHNSTNNFMPQGNLTQLTAGDKSPSPVLAATAAPLQPQTCSQAHRFPLDAAGLVEGITDGGNVLGADDKSFGASTAMSGLLSRFKPGALRQLHWHTNGDEWHFVLSGTIQSQLYFQPGALLGVYTLGANDIGYIPKGVGHFMKNPDPESEAWVLMIFNNSTITNMQINNWLGNYPRSYTALSLDASMGFVRSFNFSRSGLIGQGPGSKPNVSYTLTDIA